MNFVISSAELLAHLQAVARVINSKNTLPILDNVLFQLDKKELVLTASDLETTLTATIELEHASGEGNIAIPSKILLESLKTFSDQPITFTIDTNNLTIDIVSENGKYTIQGYNASDFPQLPSIKPNKSTQAIINSEALYSGINKTLFAASDDDMRPVMTGILIEFNEDNLTFVASDGHKLVRYKRIDVSNTKAAAFILPQKAASMLKAILPRETGEIQIQFDEKNAFFTMSNYKMICRLIEGNYPNYNAVIPKDNSKKMIVNKNTFSSTIKRVSVFSNQASNLIKLSINGNELIVSAQDIDFSISGQERIPCQYEGEEIEIGFKSVFLIEILSNLDSNEVVLEMSDPTRAGVILPLEKTNENEDILMLLMPMMINY